MWRLAGAPLHPNYCVCKGWDILIFQAEANSLVAFKRMWCWELQCEPVNKDRAQLAVKRLSVFLQMLSRMPSISQPLAVSHSPMHEQMRAAKWRKTKQTNVHVTLCISLKCNICFIIGKILNLYLFCFWVGLDKYVFYIMPNFRNTGEFLDSIKVIPLIFFTVEVNSWHY